MNSRFSLSAPARSIGNILALDTDARGDVTQLRRGQIAQVGAAWPLAMVALLLAPGTAFVFARIAGQTDAMEAAAMRGALIAGFALIMLVQLKLRFVQSWPAHVQVRIVALCAAGLGVGLMDLLPVARLAGQPATFIAIFAAIAITAIAVHPLRAATLALSGALTAMVAIESGIGSATLVAALAMTCLAVVTIRLARRDLALLADHAAAASEGRLAAQLVREVEDHGDGWFWQTDRHGRISYLSAKVGEELARNNIDPLGAALTDVFRMDVAGERERTLGFHLSSRTSFSDYAVCPAHDEEGERWWSISGRPVLDHLGHFRGFVGSGRDLTERRRSEAEITRLALFDGLTGLANRRRMRDSLDKTLAPLPGTPRITGLFLLDLDRFKAVNDTLGHQIGDTLLRQVAQRLQRAVGDAGLVGRLGGDEFKVVLPGEGNRERLGELAARIIQQVSQPYFIDGSSISIGCSIGIAISPEDGTDSETLIRNADLALYAAKGDGRGVHRFFREEMLSGARARKRLEDDLRHALAAGQFHVAYQPVVSTQGCAIVGYEALLRWNHPTRGAISPADFIPIAEECGLIESIGEWVLRTATREAATWPDHIRVAVNVSPIQFANPGLPALVASALANAQFAPHRLELEITESVFVNDGESSEQMFRSLKNLGVRLALDDFGTGYSSLGYLKKAPFDKIKIDQSFVRGTAVPGNRNAAIIRAIVTLANTLDMETTAEGVEHEDEVALIRDLGCSHIQGYVYGKPMRSEDVIRQLEAGGGQATPQGFRVSRSPRSAMLRTATIDVGSAQGEVHIRNISSTGALIDGIEFPGDPSGRHVRIALVEGQMVTGTIRWAKGTRIGVEFAEPFDLDRLNVAPARPALRRAG